MRFKPFFIGMLVGTVVVLSWKAILFLGLCGVIFIMWTASFMDWSGDGDGRQWRNNNHDR